MIFDRLNEWACWLWDWAKRIFGRSKIVFANIMAAILEVWVMAYDPISMFNWDSVTDKHEVAVMIGIGITVVNVILRNWFSDGPTSFKALPEPEVIPDEESLERSPKAN
jgi:hypothetical protein